MLPDDDNEHELRLAMTQYQPQSPDWLATRIIARATAQPQKVGFFTHLTRAFGEWDYALQMKGAALAAFAMLGVLTAQLNATENYTPAALDVTTVLMADPNWTEEL